MKLTIDDLLQPCSRCGGSGADPERIETLRDGFEIPAMCSACRGTGELPTETGRAIELFLARMRDLRAQRQRRSFG